ncbi:hypothetical protein [Herbaspirillum sp. alder98]|uniref:hypothetical protein n=1 Tax=Herbaspirillum sp. alder98 TaxID=2913096 RepID=UPI001CD8FA6C|nr:hypothetical protein [Herbaspirillum sp. alder98]MCA1326698.1 hypothetical protein [Herbaspirillum sp. alder98]
MQYTIYVGLGLCVACLAASLAVHFLFERRWQRHIEQDAQAVMAGARYKEPVRDDSMSPLQWQELRLRVEEMQIVAEETGRPQPYKNVA